MAPRRRPRPSAAERIGDASDSTLLDVLDDLLTKGAAVSGDVTLGLAGVDLIYLRLSVLLCAADRLLPPPERRRSRKTR